VNLTVSVPDFRGLMAELRAQMRLANTEAMRRSARAFEKRMEAATEAAGLGKRMARTWQSETYPKDNYSLGPAGFVWSKAPEPMRAFTSGVTIRGKGGGFLAIPSAEVLKVRGVSVAGDRNKRITPGGFERATGIKLRLIKGEGRIGFLIGDRAVGGGIGRNTSRQGGFRALTKGRIKKGAVAKPFLAFTLVPAVTLRKRIDLEALQRAWQTDALAELARAATAAITRAQLEVQTGGEFGRTRLGRTR
jgi:hypothetical protein